MSKILTKNFKKPYSLIQLVNKYDITLFYIQSSLIRGGFSFFIHQWNLQLRTLLLSLKCL